ncbi:MAG TPA: winged helix DNA-binding domain-containing protein [Gemmatimonadaceae bacterium]|nr:winged helix DNA-binding domain-containing protein [Gemmatimonadaceae bacterium]
MNAKEIVRRRLAGQWLSVPGLESASEVVERQGAVQAQDYPGAVWALSQRTRAGLSEAAIDAEIDSGQILRTHVLRPTWHFVSPRDIRWMLALTAPRVKQVMASYNRKLELTSAVFRRSHAIIEKALAGGQHRTRTELKSLLERAKISTTPSQRLGHLMMEAELDAIVCSGPRRGKQSTYALVDERAPRTTQPYDRDESLGALARRYFATRSPATAHDFAWWSGLTIGDARRAIQVAGHLRAWRNDERTYWLDDAAEVPRSKRTTHLLPNYDEYFIGYRDRSAIGGRIASIAAVTGGNALISHVAFVDGMLVGGWRRLVEGNEVVVAFTPVATLSPAERRRFEAESTRLARFLGRPVALRWK